MEEKLENCEHYYNDGYCSNWDTEKLSERQTSFHPLCFVHHSEDYSLSDCPIKEIQEKIGD